MGKNVIISTLPNISQNYLPKVNTSNIFANSLVYDDGSSVLINTTTASAYKLDVNGTGRFQGALTGTSATFSSSVTAGQGLFTSSSFPLDLTANTNNYGIRLTSVQAPTLLLYSTFNNANNRNWGIYTNYAVFGDFAIAQSNAKDGDLTTGANGTARLYIKNDGNVGIGTTSPDVTGFGYTTLTIKGGTTAGYAGVLELQTTQTTTNGQNVGIIAFLDGTSRNAQIGVQRDTSTSTSNMMFYTNAGSGIVERMRITSGGNVGIGVTSVNGLLALKASISDTPVLRFQNNITSGLDAALSTYASSTQTYLVIGTNLFINSTGNFQRFNTSYESSAIAFDEGTIGFSTNTTAANATRRMTITSGGNVLIGRTDSGLTNSDGVTISDGAVQIEGNGYVFYGNRTASNGLFMGIRRNNVDVGDISVTTTSTSFNTSSDYRLKEDLKDFNALSIINMIKAYDFKWKLDNTRMYGVLAHELQSILPYSVTGIKDGERMQSADYSKLTPILVKAIQEQQAQIEEQKADIESLKALINK